MARLALAVASIAALIVVPTAFGTDASGATASCGGVTTNSSVNAWHPGSVAASSPRWYRFSQTSTDRVLVTLGGLKADLSLDVYDSTCHLVASSHRTGDLYEEIYRYQSAGTYYARISSATGGSSTYQVKFRVLPNAITVVTSRAQVENGRITVVGEELNNTDRELETNQVDIIFYDGSNHVLTTGWNTTDSINIPAWQRAPFEVISTVPPTYASYRVFFEGVDYLEPGDDMRVNVTHGPTVVGSDGSKQYPGTIENPNAATVHHTLITGVMRDAYGSVLYIAQDDNSTYLGPGKSENYLLRFPVYTGENLISFYVGACNGDVGC